jgi:predicted Zn-ribbon and HTH transcriptional regulator
MVQGRVQGMAQGMQDVLGPLLRTLVRCRVCGFSEVRTDEVVDRGLVLLAECPRCEHRWTQRAARPLRVAPAAARRVAPAA